MAHWIIDYRGFGGTYYKCSECGENWCDIYSDVSMKESCPNCGALINEDEVEYIEKKKKKTFSLNPAPVTTKIAETIRAYDEMETILINLSGYGMKKLIELFAAGYTLQPPTYLSFEDLEKEV